MKNNQCTLLMCKNTPVYNIDTEEIYNQSLLPGYIREFSSKDILKHFGLAGFQMILLDTIIGNGDRNAGNFGWLRDTDTGEYVSMAPLYDFDHALDSKSTGDIMIKEAIQLAKSNNTYKTFALQAINKLLAHEINQIFRAKAESILSNIAKSLN